MLHQVEIELTQMIKKAAVVMPFYSKRSKMKNKIRASKMDSTEFAMVGKEKMRMAG